MRRTALVAEPPALEDTVPTLHAMIGADRRKLVMVQTQAEGAGAQEISRILGDGLNAKGYDVHHVFFFRRTAAFDGLPQTFFCEAERPGNPLALMRMLLRLIRHLRELRPDVVLCFQHYGNLIGALAARIAGARVVVANRTSAKRHIPFWLRLLDLLLGLSGAFTRVIVNSKSVTEEYRRYPLPYRARVLHIDHGFEAKTTTLNREAARKLLHLPEEIILLGSVARLHPVKNLEAVIRLLPTDKRWHAAFAGQGPARAALENFACRLGVLDRVHFLGELSSERIGVFLRSLDVFVFPSLAETFGLAAVEAAHAGIPVVANDLEVLREVLATDGKPCALFAEARNERAFTAAVRQVLGDKTLSAKLSAQGRALAQRYSAAAMIDAYATLIETILPRPIGTFRNDESR